jgi:hypothetical protein
VVACPGSFSIALVAQDFDVTGLIIHDCEEWCGTETSGKSGFQTTPISTREADSHL